jgi:hypothetical protein
MENQVGGLQHTLACKIWGYSRAQILPDSLYDSIIFLGGKLIFIAVKSLTLIILMSFPEQKRN